MIANAPPIIVTDPPGKPPITGVLDAGAFWPHIDLAKLRDTVDVDGSVTAARLTHAASSDAIFQNQQALSAGQHRRHIRFAQRRNAIQLYNSDRDALFCKQLCGLQRLINQNPIG